MKKHSSKQDGLTLIESMVVLAIVSILGGMAASLGSDFFDQSARRQVREQLQMAYHKARSAAVKNVSALPAGEVNALMCVGSDHVLRVFVQDDSKSPAVDLPTSCTATGTSSVWVADVAGGAQTKINQDADNSLGCVAFDKTGRPIDHSIGTKECFTGSSVEIKRGSRSINMNWLGA